MSSENRLADVVVVGAGIFGVTSAEALARRGHRVTLLDPGPIPHPQASSTDISKAIRSDYGSDGFYTNFAIQAMQRWREWNGEAGETMFHEVGFLAWSSGTLEAGGFEADCQRLNREAGIPIERLTPEEVRRRFPSIAGMDLGEAHFNPCGGWAPSGRVVAWRLEHALRAGVRVQAGFRARRLLERNGAVFGVESTDGIRVEGESIVVAAGAWTSALVPWLSDRLRPSAQTVFHFDARSDPGLACLPVWCADISRTGWYGFPADPQGRFKVGHHGLGRQIDPVSNPPVQETEEGRFRRFLAGRFPTVAGSPAIKSRICFYCDSFDGDFWIDRDPDRRGLTVAAGGSGHGFKFAPLLGDWIADAVEGRPSVDRTRFRWRDAGAEKREEARSSA